MQFYGFMILYEAHPAIDQTAYKDAYKKNHLDVPNVLQSVQLNQNIKIKSLHFVGSYHTDFKLLRQQKRNSINSREIFKFVFLSGVSTVIADVRRQKNLAAPLR
jgi:hypothetical protein